MPPLKSLRRRVGVFFADETGNFAMLAAIFVPVAVICIAIVVDLAMISLERRRARSAVDLAAIVAAQNLHAAEKAARETLALNGHATITSAEFGRLDEEERDAVKTTPRVSVERGRYEPDPDVARAERFRPGGQPYNAARVSLSKQATLYFSARFTPPPTLDFVAVASAEQIAAFSVGSRLLSLKEGIANELLSALTGSEVSLSLLDYNALLDADVDVLTFMDALALEIDISSGRYRDVLASEPTLADVLDALARVQTDKGDSVLSQTLSRLSDAAAVAGRRVDLARLIDLGPIGEVALGAPEAKGMPIRADLMELVFMNALAANGETLLQLDLAASVPGLSSLTARLSIGELLQSSPWLRVGFDDDIVSNVQIRLEIVASALGEGALKSVAVKIPLYFEIARAEARLGDVRCPGGRESEAEVDIFGRPGVVDLWLGEADLSAKVTSETNVEPARIVTTPALRIKGKARAKIDNIDETKFTFDAADIEAGVFKSDSTTDILESLMTSLGKDLELEIQVLGLGLGTGPLLEPLTSGIVANTLGLVDEPVAALLETLGVRVGEADIRVNGVRCNRSVLVQ